jgi:hypothetical protein
MIQITDKAMEISDDIAHIFDGKIVSDCLGALIITLTHQILYHSDDPEQALAGLGICVAQVSAIVNSFVNDHPANDPVWTEKKKKYTLQ